jgi:hypothetical protein
MVEYLPSTPPPTSYHPMSATETWTQALPSPSEETYDRIARDPGASLGKAVGWVFAAGLIAGAISACAQYALAAMLPEYSGAYGLGANTDMTSLLCAIPFTGVFAVIGFFISTGISNLVARALGGVGTFEQLAYAYAAYYTPLTIVSSILGAIPIVGLLGIPIGIYGIVLNVIATKAVHRFSWGKAILASFVVFALVLVVVACMVIVILTLLGPQIGNVFSGIVEELGTPSP